MILKKNNRHTESDTQLFKHIFPTVVLGFQEGRTPGNEYTQAFTDEYTVSAETVSSSHQDESAEPTQLSAFKANDWIIEIKGNNISRNNDAVAPPPALRSNDSHAMADRDRRILNDMTTLYEDCRHCTTNNGASHPSVLQRPENLQPGAISQDSGTTSVKSHDVKRIVVTTEIAEAPGVDVSHTALYALYVDRGIGLEYLGLHTRTTLELLEIKVSKNDPARCKSLPNLQIYAHNHFLQRQPDQISHDQKGSDTCEPDSGEP